MNHKTSVYTNIKQSRFKDLKIYPCKTIHMLNFIQCHDGWDFWKIEDWILVTKNKEMNVCQLNSLFLILQHIHMGTEKMVKTLEQNIEDHLIVFDDAPIIKELLAKNTAISLLARKIVGNGNDILDISGFRQAVDEGIHTIIRVGHDIDDDMTTDFESAYNKILNCLSTFEKQFNDFINSLYKITIDFINDHHSLVSLIMELCADNSMSLSMDKNQVLEDFLNEYKLEGTDSLECSDAIDAYYAWIDQDFSEYNSDSYEMVGYSSDDFNSAFTEDFDSKNLTIFDQDDINQTLQVIGYELAPNPTHVSRLANCLVQHEFETDVEDVALVVHNTLVTDRYSSYYINKLDSRTLEEYYNIINSTNDHVTSYDEIVEITATGSIPYALPIEFQLRLISRIYGVIIHFYTMDLVYMKINNVISNNSYEITVYQHMADRYYNIVKLGESFKPCCNTDYTHVHTDWDKIDGTITDTSQYYDPYRQTLILSDDYLKREHCRYENYLERKYPEYEKHPKYEKYLRNSKHERYDKYEYLEYKNKFQKQGFHSPESYREQLVNDITNVIEV